MIRPRCSPIGIDVGARSIKAAQLGRAGRAWGVRTLARLTRSTPGLPGAAEAVRLADSLGRLGFQGRRVVLAVPEDRLLTSVFELPPRSSGAPLEQMAIMELARSVRRDARSLEAACWEVPAPTRAGAGTHLMAAACAHAEAETLLDAFEAAGLIPELLDARAWAMARAAAPALRRAGAREDGLAAVLDLGDGAAVLVVLCGGRAGGWAEAVVVYERVVPEYGLGHLRTTLCEQLGYQPDVADHVLRRLGPGGPAPAPAQAADLTEWPAMDQAAALVEAHLAGLVAETRAALEYVGHRYQDRPMERVLVLGDGASMPGLAAHLGDGDKGLGVATGVLTPGLIAGGDAAEHADDPALSVAVGLAIGGEGVASEWGSLAA